jgi:hypothetical protein
MEGMQPGRQAARQAGRQIIGPCIYYIYGTNCNPADFQLCPYFMSFFLVIKNVETKESKNLQKNPVLKRACSTRGPGHKTLCRLVVS